MASLKPNEQIFADLTSVRAFLPVGSVSLQNYRDVIASSGVGAYALNSAFVTIVTVCAGLVVNSLAAFSLARLEWRGKGIILGLIVILLIVPLEAIAVPMMLMVAYLPTIGFDGGISIQWSWLDTRLVQIVPFVANAFSIFFFYQAFSDIPRDFDEAAYVDGATPYQVYRHVIVPLSGTTFATVAIIQGLAAWNQYLWPVIVVPSEEARPLMVGLQQFFRFQTEWGQVMAYATLATLPVFTAFVFFQRWFVQSVMGSGVKG
ncbi:multiple sugar transport system permease protein [Sphingomonas zeicaulis]|uniref:carbohydrate ABC transporter permease n=1 Tax=Sphingomonas zeicaulis TaxID=1632740 RepID=UPI003D1B335A